MAKYEVAVRALQAQPVVYTRGRAPFGDAGAIGNALGAAFGVVGQFGQSHGAQMAGPPYARFLSPPGGTMDFEAGMPVVAAVPGEGEVESGELPAGEAAVTTHVGPFDTLRAGYEAIEGWMREHNRSGGGPPWEVYMTDPQLEPDPQKWRTDIYWPLA
jgi:effector-binding domain-containing protein